MLKKWFKMIIMISFIYFKIIYLLIYSLAF